MITSFVTIGVMEFIGGRHVFRTFEINAREFVVRLATLQVGKLFAPSTNHGWQPGISFTIIDKDNDKSHHFWGALYQYFSMLPHILSEIVTVPERM